MTINQTWAKLYTEKKAGGLLGDVFGGAGRALGGVGRSLSRFTGLAGSGARRAVSGMVGNTPGLGDELSSVHTALKKGLPGLKWPTYIGKGRIGGGHGGMAEDFLKQYGDKSSPLHKALGAGTSPVDAQRLEALHGRLSGLTGNKLDDAGKAMTAPQVLDSAKRRWYDWALPVGGATALGAATSGGEKPANPSLAAEPIVQPNQPNAFERGMSGIGQTVGGWGMPGVGEWIQNNPYLAGGIGAGGAGVLIALLMKLLGGGQR